MKLLRRSDRALLVYDTATPPHAAPELAASLGTIVGVQHEGSQTWYAYFRRTGFVAAKPDVAHQWNRLELAGEIGEAAATEGA